MLNLIFCVDKNGLFGRKNKLPWNFKEELKYFKNITTEFNTDIDSYVSEIENKNNVIVMGYNTWTSITKKLPNRINVVISSRYVINQTLVVSKDKSLYYNQSNQNNLNEFPDYIYKSFVHFLEDCKKNKLFYKKNIFIIGGKYLLSYVISKYNKFIKYIFMNVIQYSFPRFIDDDIFNIYSFTNFKITKQSNQQISCLNSFDGKFYIIEFNNYINSQFDINNVLNFIDTTLCSPQSGLLLQNKTSIIDNNIYQRYQKPINSDLYTVLENDIQNIDDFCEDCEETTNERCNSCKCKLKCLFC